jgi:hypothetical protein
MFARFSRFLFNQILIDTSVRLMIYCESLPFLSQRYSGQASTFFISLTNLFLLIWLFYYSFFLKLILFKRREIVR